jgi:Cof subfamily protein (haloacid dehalogenase superfamily)
LALDLDGTLVRDDGAIDPRDLAAVHAAMHAGVVVTIATGRLSSGTLESALALGVDVPMICADGSALVCSHSGLLLEEEPIAPAAVDRVLATLADRPIAPFVFEYDGAHGDARGERVSRYVIAWASRLTRHPRLRDALERRSRATGTLLAVGIGAREEVEEARRELAGQTGLDIGTFCLQGDDWALRVQNRGSSKGAGLSRLAQRLGIPRTRVAVVGDWYNDLSMFAWAGRSFAMGQAPEAVRLAATDALASTARTGGGVAEALGRWLEG